MDLSLLEIAKIDLGSAKVLAALPDDAYLRMSAYHVEQAVEKTLKQVLVFYGVQLKKNHVFRHMLMSLPEDQIVITEEHFNMLVDNSDRLTNWATELEYVLDYSTTRNEVMAMLQFANDFYTVVSERLTLLNASLQS